jgi:hypothetical protein
VTGTFEHGNKLSLSIKCGKILDWLRNYKLLKKCFVKVSGSIPSAVTGDFFRGY